MNRRTQLSVGRRIFLCCNLVFCLLVSIVCVMPVIHVIAVSFSSKEAIMAGQVGLWPVKATLDNYAYVVKDAQFYTSFFVSCLRVLLSQLVCMTLTVVAAFPFSKSNLRFPARKVYVVLYLIPMIFSGGMIPTYIVVAKTGLINSLWALILPVAVPVYHVVLLQNFMKSLPEALCESAEIDGARQITVLARVILPLCAPSLATLSLFTAVGHWNAWFDGMLYINKAELFPLQTYLRSVIIIVDTDTVNDLQTYAKRVSILGADSAKIFLAMLPIMCVYPFLQKYFVKGLTVGSVKG